MQLAATPIPKLPDLPQPAHDRVSIQWMHAGATPDAAPVRQAYASAFVTSSDPRFPAVAHAAFEATDQSSSAKAESGSPAVVEAARGVQLLLEQAFRDGLLQRQRTELFPKQPGDVVISLSYDAFQPAPARVLLRAADAPEPLRAALEAAARVLPLTTGGV